MHAQDKVSKSEYEVLNQDTGAGFWIHYPKMNPSSKFGTFHPKLMLLKFPNKLRVVITSANLRKEDWLLMGQVIWFQDFEERNVDTKKENDSQFFKYLQFFLIKLIPQGWDKTFMEFLNGIDIRKYDFSKAAVKLVGSISGRFTQSGQKLGINRLRQVVDQGINNLKKKKVAQKHTLQHFFNRKQTQIQDQKEHKEGKNCISYMASSIGSMNIKWLQSFYQSVFPNQNVSSQTLLSRYRLMYPTLSQVEACHLGIQMGGFLFLRKTVYQKGKDIYNKILSKIDHQNKALDLNLYHTKVGIFSQEEQDGEEKSKDDGGKKKKIRVTDKTTIYMGSHNFSQAAWGNIEKKGAQISMMNYQLGVIFPPQIGSTEMKKRIIQSLPFEIPPASYNFKEDVPFMQDAL